MKNLLYELNVTKILLILSVITGCLTKNELAISISVMSLVAFACVDKYLTILSMKSNREDEFESVNKAIIELESKVSHLSNKDVAKDLLGGLAPKR
jgi:hypothetical protein